MASFEPRLAMRRTFAAVCVACLAAGCGSGERSSSQSGADSVRTASDVASPTVGPGTSARLFCDPWPGPLHGSLQSPGRASVAYTAAADASQLVGPHGSSQRAVDPASTRTHRARSAMPRNGQVAILSKG